MSELDLLYRPVEIKPDCLHFWQHFIKGKFPQCGMCAVMDHLAFLNLSSVSTQGFPVCLSVFMLASPFAVLAQVKPLNIFSVYK